MKQEPELGKAALIEYARMKGSEDFHIGALAASRMRR